MNEHRQAAVASEPQSLRVSRWNELFPCIGVRVDRQTTLPGTVELKPLGDHRLKIHAGNPVRGWCNVQPFLYTRGDVDILPAGYADAWHEDDPSTSIMVQLSPSLLQRAAEETGADAHRSSLVVRHQLRDQRIEHIAWALDAERTSGYANGLVFAESLSLALAIHLLGNFQAPVKLRRGLSKRQQQRVTTYIEDHINQDLSLATLASVAGISASYLKVVFRRSTGLPVHQYIVQRRVARARMLLSRGDLPVSQVALEAGFADQSHMARCMRRVLGVTPKAVGRAT